MTDSPFLQGDAWDASFAQARAALRQWRDAHPRATFNEIEAAVDAEAQRVRAHGQRGRCGRCGLSDLRATAACARESRAR